MRKLRAAQAKNKEEILKKNIEVLSSIDLHDMMNNYEDRIKRLVALIYDLFEVLQLDDSVVANLHRIGDDLTVDDLSEIVSIVQEFNINGKFQTLSEYYQDELKDILGDDKFQSKLKRSKALKLQKRGKLK